MSFVSDTDVLTAVAEAGLHKLLPDISQTVWQCAAQDGNAAAYAQIRKRLREVGYSQAQIDAWSDGPAYQKSLAYFETVIRAAGEGTEPNEWSKQLDYWRGQIAALEVIDVAGELPDPEDAATAVGSGGLNTANDMFVRPTRHCDRRIGRTTRF